MPREVQWSRGVCIVVVASGVLTLLACTLLRAAALNLALQTGLETKTLMSALLEQPQGMGLYKQFTAVINRCGNDCQGGGLSGDIQVTSR